MWLHVQAWVKHRWRLKDKEAVPEPTDIPLSIEGKLALKDVELIVLVGLPGGSLHLCSGSLLKLLREGTNKFALQARLTLSHSTWHSCCLWKLSLICSALEVCTCQVRQSRAFSGAVLGRLHAS